MKVESLNGMTVLLVDDEKFSRKLVSSMLLDMGHPNVLEAVDGADATHALEDHKVDLIISDFNMPDVHGLELLRTVRTAGTKAKRDLPFAMLTGYSEKALIDMALALDANAFLIKPISHEGLKSRILKMLDYIDSGPWLKDTDTYQNIDVSGILEDLALPERRDSTVSLHRPLPENRPLFEPSADNLVPSATKDLAQKDAEIKSLAQELVLEEFDENYDPRDDAPTIADAETAPGERLCPLDQLPDDAVITRDVFTADGSLFMHAGTQLTPLIITILNDLQELGHPVDDIRIKDDGA